MMHVFIYPLLFHCSQNLESIDSKMQFSDRSTFLNRRIIEIQARHSDSKFLSSYSWEINGAVNIIKGKPQQNDTGYVMIIILSDSIIWKYFEPDNYFCPKSSKLPNTINKYFMVLISPQHTTNSFTPLNFRQNIFIFSSIKLKPLHQSFTYTLLLPIPYNFTEYKIWNKEKIPYHPWFENIMVTEISLWFVLTTSKEKSFFNSQWSNEKFICLVYGSWKWDIFKEWFLEPHSMMLMVFHHVYLLP